jgi:hypothetical protein
MQSLIPNNVVRRGGWSIIVSILTERTPTRRSEPYPSTTNAILKGVSLGVVFVAIVSPSNGGYSQQGGNFLSHRSHRRHRHPETGEIPDGSVHSPLSIKIMPNGIGVIP